MQIERCLNPAQHAEGTADEHDRGGETDDDIGAAFQAGGEPSGLDALLEGDHVGPGEVPLHRALQPVGLDHRHRGQTLLGDVG